MTVLTHRTAATAGVPDRPEAFPARLTTTVPREYVHRASLAEVFLTGCRRTDGTRFALTGQWPRAHTFFTSADGLSHDPMQAAETIRQVGLFLAHAQFGVPLDHQFLLHDMEYSTDPGRLLVGRGPTNLDLEADCTDLVWKGNRLARFAMHVRIGREGHLAAAGSGRFTCVAPATYRRLRGEARRASGPPAARPGPVTPRLVGRTLPRDVVLARGGRPGSWLLSADARHPVLFDHVGDHVPGMVLVEAARQAACALVAPRTFAPTGATTVFHRYVEYDAPCRIDAALAPRAAGRPARVAVTGWQDGHQVFGTELTGRLS
ncbi:ScbA/BarX family gamma-butyrolactone biosynthesis protein [Streptomyces sp. NPDC050703]|uniref:ScbA/BarX family gamma-butyrolactone biosynthesis protein n=1 Tax=Streptomyces sp. NPDC050703 TaxID=3157218 RepID=UPI00341B2965